MRYLFTLLLLIHIPKHNCLKLDILLIGDFSNSTRGYEKFTVNAFQEFVNKYELDEEGIQIGIIIFNDAAYLISPLTSDKIALQKHIRSMYNLESQGTTSMHNALYSAIEEFYGKTGNGRDGYQKIIIIVTDGAPNAQGLTLEAADMVKASNTLIFGVLIKSREADEEFMKQLSSPNCYLSTNYENLIEELKRLDICL